MLALSFLQELRTNRQTDRNIKPNGFLLATDKRFMFFLDPGVKVRAVQAWAGHAGQAGVPGQVTYRKSCTLGIWGRGEKREGYFCF